MSHWPTLAFMLPPTDSSAMAAGGAKPTQGLDKAYEDRFPSASEALLKSALS